jgi:hypothetical protein
MTQTNRINLDNALIAAPCNADWNEMVGDERVRHCSLCRLSVYNISEMTRLEAEELLSKSGSKLCLKLFRRSDGTLLTKDCSMARKILERTKQRMKLAAAAIAGFLNIAPVWAQQIVTVERYGWGVGIPQDIDATNQALRNAIRMRPDNGHVNATALGAFNKALEYESEGKHKLALLFYRSTVFILRKDRAKYDPKFTELVGSKYASLLRKNGDKETARAIEKEFYREKK